MLLFEREERIDPAEQIDDVAEARALFDAHPGENPVDPTFGRGETLIEGGKYGLGFGRRATVKRTVTTPGGPKGGSAFSNRPERRGFGTRCAVTHLSTPVNIAAPGKEK
jgi:hypothetical protein